MALKQRDSGEKYVVRYADGCRLCHVFILAPIFAAMTAFWIYVFTQIDDGKSMFFCAAIAAFTLIISAIVVYTSFRAYMVKARIDENGIECTSAGKRLKGLSWGELKDIVRVEYRHFGAGSSPSIYLLFSGHELSAEEKDKSIQLAGLKNNIIVVKYSKELVEQINQAHEFTFKDEVKRC